MGGIRTAAQYQAQLRALLPSGPAWDPERVPELEEVLQGVAVELARLDSRAADLLNEMDPAGVSELVPDWERVMELPDPCLGATPLFDDRRLAVRRRLLAVGSQAVGYYLDIAKSQGYPNASITEHEAPAWAARVSARHTGAPGRRNSCGRSTPAAACCSAGATARATGASASASTRARHWSA